MKKLMLALALLIPIASKAGDVYTTELPPNQRLCIVAPRQISSATAYATNQTYVHGQIITANTRQYMMISTGSVLTLVTAANAPDHLNGDATKASIAWRRLWKPARAWADIVLVSGGPIYTSEGPYASTNAGGYMIGVGASDVYSGQQAIWAISSTNAVVTVREIEKP